MSSNYSILDKEEEVLIDIDEYDLDENNTYDSLDLCNYITTTIKDDKHYYKDVNNSYGYHLKSGYVESGLSHEYIIVKEELGLVHSKYNLYKLPSMFEFIVKNSKDISDKATFSLNLKRNVEYMMYSDMASKFSENKLYKETIYNLTVTDPIFLKTQKYEDDDYKCTKKKKHN